MVSQGYIHVSWMAPKQKQYGGKTWWRKATHVVAARKQNRVTAPERKRPGITDGT